jgi:hypothetical protein
MEVGREGEEGLLIGFYIGGVGVLGSVRRGGW